MVSMDCGVVAPVIKEANRKGLNQIHSDVREIMTEVVKREHVSSDAESERDSKNMDLFEGGTFTISNVGMYDVKSLSAIVSPNQACSLGLGTISKRVVPNEDPLTCEKQIYKYATQITATLACDHRVIDGSTGAQWLASFKELVEDPLRMIL